MPYLTTSEIADYIENYAGYITLSEYVFICKICNHGDFDYWYNEYSQMRKIYDGRKFEDLNGKEQLEACYAFEEWMHRD